MSFDPDKIKQMLDDFELEMLLPDLSNLESTIMTLTRLAVMAGPLVLLFLGLQYLLSAPKEANYTTGYRCWFGMGSVQAWQFAQRIAGTIWIALGIVMAAGTALHIGNLLALPIMDAMFLAGKYLIQQAVTVFCSTIFINIVVFLRYDRKGIRRATWGELLRKER